MRNRRGCGPGPARSGGELLRPPRVSDGEEPPRGSGLVFSSEPAHSSRRPIERYPAGRRNRLGPASARADRRLGAQSLPRSGDRASAESGLASCLEARDSLTCGDDRNALMLAQRQQMTLGPRRDQAGASGHGRGQHMIVIGIRGHHPRRRGRRNNHGQLAQFIDQARRRHTRLREPHAELRSRQNVQQFGLQYFAGAQLEGIGLGSQGSWEGRGLGRQGSGKAGVRSLISLTSFPRPCQRGHVATCARSRRIPAAGRSSGIDRPADSPAREGPPAA